MSRKLESSQLYMETLLQFKTRMDQLDQIEFIDLIKTCDMKELISCSLFQYFHNKLNSTKSLKEIQNTIIPQIQKINDNMFAIITRREDECVTESAALNLNELPAVMISSISSFLPFSDVLNLEKCNKSIFIGTRSSVSSYSLSSYSSKLIEYVKITNNIFHWYRFKSGGSIKEFQLEMDDYYQWDSNEEYLEYGYKLCNIPIWNDLEQLTISTTFSIEENCMEFFTQMLNDFSTFNLSKLKTIKITEKFYNDTSYIMSTILKMKEKKLLNVEFIYVEWDDCSNIEILPDGLRGFAVNDPICSNPPQNIESLHGDTVEMLIKKRCILNNLREICLGFTSQLIIDFINKQNLQKLQRINLGGIKLEWFENFKPLIFLLKKKKYKLYINSNAKYERYDTNHKYIN
eukprot:463093_1